MSDWHSQDRAVQPGCGRRGSVGILWEAVVAAIDWLRYFPKEPQVAGKLIP